MRNILVTGGDGRFAKVLKQKNKLMNLTFLSKSDCNIMNLKSIEKIFRKKRPAIVLHCAALSRPMSVHDKDIIKSINTNIIGTANVVMACKKLNIKLIYFSTGYVYGGKRGNHSEIDSVKPFNNYGLSKLGGECSVAMYKNSLILRITMTEKPFLPKKAYSNLYANFMYHEDLVKILPKILDQKGILNIGGKSQSIYNFVKKTNPKIIKTSLRDGSMPLNQTMNISRLKKCLE